VKLKKRRDAKAAAKPKKTPAEPAAPEAPAEA
jgi:hypothetical protein